MENELTGRVFGRWLALGERRRYESRRQWLCRCSCEAGTVRWVDEANLLAGKSKSCGCLSAQRAKGRRLELAGERFGELEVLGRAENVKGRTAWECRCSCGRLCVRTTHELRQEGRVSCGCRSGQKGKNIRDLTGLVFEGLEVVSPTSARDKKGCVLWKCRCRRCKREKVFSEDAIVHGNYKSCGCGQRVMGPRLIGYRHFYQGTSPEALGRKRRADNTSGVTGISRLPNGKYRAGIGFQGRVYSLGTYESLEEAAGARRSAEEALHVRFMEAYSSWEEEKERYGRGKEGSGEGSGPEELVFEAEYVNGEFTVRTNYPAGR